jgi:hypothetical protein
MTATGGGWDHMAKWMMPTLKLFHQKYQRKSCCEGGL